MAPFMIIGRWVRNRFAWPALHLRAEKESCRECGTCTEACPMGLDAAPKTVEWGKGIL